MEQHAEAHAVSLEVLEEPSFKGFRGGISVVRVEENVNDVSVFPSGSPCPELHLPGHGGPDPARYDEVPIRGEYGVANSSVILFEPRGDVDDPHSVGEVLDLQLAPAKFGRQVPDVLVGSAKLHIAMSCVLFNGRT